eukprot:6482790-Pyramimonas_sp.AAC.1
MERLIAAHPQVRAQRSRQILQGGRSDGPQPTAREKRGGPRQGRSTGHEALANGQLGGPASKLAYK